ASALSAERSLKAPQATWEHPAKLSQTPRPPTSPPRSSLPGQHFRRRTYQPPSTPSCARQPRTASGRPSTVTRSLGSWAGAGWGLGRGGRGVVYKVRQVQPKRFAALKMLLPEFPADKEPLPRSRIEVEAAARLQHPCIVHIYQVGEHQGRPFYSMEYVEGG